MRYTIPDLLPGTPYAIQVRAVNTDSYSDWSVTHNFVTAQNVDVPAAPGGVTWAVNGNGFTGAWNAVSTTVLGGFSKVVAYEVELTAASQTHYVAVPPQDAGTLFFTLSYDENKAMFGTPQPAVGFRVRAVDSAGLKSAFSTIITATNPAPNPPTSAVVTAGVNVVALQWTASTSDDVDHYNVYVGSTAGFTPSSSNRKNVGRTLSYNYVSTTYTLTYFKIRAVDIYGQESTDLTAQGTPVSPFVVDTTPPADPTNLTVNVTDDPNGILLAQTATATWTYPTTDASLAGFHIRWAKHGTSNWSVMGFGPDERGPVVVSATLEPNQAYDFQIRAFDYSANKSAWYSTDKSAVAPTIVPELTNAIVVQSGGYIESSAYTVGGTIGWHIDDDEIIINNGTIRGQAISTGLIASNQIGRRWDDSSQGYIADPDGQPAWFIDLEGDAKFSNLEVIGAVILGSGSEDPSLPSTFASFNYEPGNLGFILRSDGTAEFMDVRGANITGANISGGSFVTFDPNNSDSGIISITGSGGLTVTGPPSVGSPTYINFPTNGAPNIISGQLTASTLAVTGGSSFAGVSAIEAGAAFTIASGLGAPKNKPALVEEYRPVIPTDTDGLLGLTYGHDGNFYSIRADQGRAGTIIKIDATTGAQTTMATIPWWSGTVNGYFKAKSIVYSSTYNMYYILGFRDEDYNGLAIAPVLGITTSWAANNQVDYDGTSFDPLNDNTAPYGIGWDYTTNRLLVSFIDRFGTVGSTFVYRLSITSGVPDNSTEFAFPTHNISTKYGSVSVMKGSFDFGIDRWIVKAGNALGYNYNIYDTTPAGGWNGSRASAYEWPSADNGSYFTWDGTAFWQIVNSPTPGLQKYELNKNYWTTSGTNTWSVGYTWYDSNATGGTHESPMSPLGTINRTKRTRVRMTADQWPTVGGTDAPNGLRVYRGIGGSPTMFLSQTPTTTSIALSDATLSTAYVIPTTLTTPAIFPASTPGSIQSSSGNSFWKGDDSAQFYQLVVNSPIDAENTAGNMPALRIGDTAGTHLRVDGNEIIAMTGNSAQGILYLNRGNRVIFDERTFQSGNVDVNCVGGTTTSVNVSFPVNFLTAPILMLTPRNSTAFNQTINYWYTSLDTNGFTLNVARTNSGTITFAWWAQDL